ncbi:putative ribonuclease H-like domain-containing protein [Rosa chinensis]|uniref:Putative ribonuclease H-like domain-containing protein n=2 Tax=Rosa chinensis TaxID=74649 RepID=A0A2P6RS70_ROSCH|nr:putative ribonuclease H-like domain-containing protein [Rosa chinensis]
MVDEVLQRRGKILCSQCSFCCYNVESVSHLFLNCPSLGELWTWLFDIFRLQLSVGLTLQGIFDSNMMNQLPVASKLLWRLAVCNIFWCIWTERNKIRFDGRVFEFRRFKQFFINSFKESAMCYFAPCGRIGTAAPVYSLLGISPLRARAPKFTPVVWESPPPGWIKANTDGSFLDPARAGFGGVFRDSDGLFLGGFSYNAAVPSAIDAEVLVVIEAVEVAMVRRWTHVWLETDSALVVRYFNKPDLIPWRWRIPWMNCLYKISHFTFQISHIFREGNALADKFARYGALNMGAVWWRKLPTSFLLEYARDLASRVTFRFS